MTSRSPLRPGGSESSPRVSVVTQSGWAAALAKRVGSAPIISHRYWNGVTVDVEGSRSQLPQVPQEERPARGPDLPAHLQLDAAGVPAAVERHRPRLARRRRGPLHRLDRLHRHRHLPGHRRERDRGHRRPAAADDDLAPPARALATPRGDGDGSAATGRKLFRDYLLQEEDEDRGRRGPLQAAADQERPRHLHAADRRPRDRRRRRRRGSSTPTTSSSSSCGGRRCRSSRWSPGSRSC